MQVTKQQFSDCRAALISAGYDIEMWGSNLNGRINLIWRWHCDVSDKADAAGRCGVRKPSGYHWPAAKTAWEQAVKHASAKPRRIIREICRQYGFSDVQIQLINTAGTALEAAARGMARVASASRIEFDGDTPIIRKVKADRVTLPVSRSGNHLPKPEIGVYSMVTNRTLRLRYRRALGAWQEFYRQHTSDHGGAGCTCTACDGKKATSQTLRANLDRASRDCHNAGIDTAGLSPIAPD
jgi:hypothetical protein